MILVLMAIKVVYRPETDCFYEMEEQVENIEVEKIGYWKDIENYSFLNRCLEQ